MLFGYALYNFPGLILMIYPYVDMVERFQISVFMCVIIVQNLSDLNWDVRSDWIVGVIWTIVTVLGSEMIVDWLKHCFVIKFNHLEPSLYRKYLSIFASDVLTQRLNPVLKRYFYLLYLAYLFLKASMDSHAIARRVGFVPLPLACLVCTFPQPVTLYSSFLSSFVYFGRCYPLMACWALCYAY